MSALGTAAREHLPGGPHPPDRLTPPPLVAWVLLLGVAALVLHGYTAGAALTPAEIVEGLPRLGEFLADAVPPDLARVGAISLAMLETLEIAVIGGLFGIAASIPLAVLGARNITRNGIVHGLARGFVAVLRTVPDLVWALIFIIAVGLGPPAGILAITVDTMGFCGRFFADEIEDVDPGTIEGVETTGASPGAVLANAVLPSVMPSFLSTSMYALELGVRSSVIIGLVGAGGVGIELSTAMNLFRYDEALTIILFIFVVVLGVERLSSRIRARLR